MRKRTVAREHVLKVLYEGEIRNDPFRDVLERYWNTHDDIVKEVSKFSNILVFGIEKNIKAIDEKISQYTDNWQLKRMAIIDKNILRMGVFELLYLEDIPSKVTINESVELAKKYGDLESSKFVNGILDKLHKTEIA